VDIAVDLVEDRKKIIRPFYVFTWKDGDPIKDFRGHGKKPVKKRTCLI
jgi:hypothetical protein